MSDNPVKRPSASANVPVSDLLKEKQQFLATFGIGTKLSADMIAEYERVTGRLRALESENARLRTAMEADGAVRELNAKIDRLEREKEELLHRFREAEASSSTFSERFQEIEAELGNLANLLVASRQLHASLSPRGVMRRVKEVLAQLVGAERYAIYFANGDRSELVPIAAEGLSGDDLGNRPTRGGVLGEVFTSGRSIILDDVDPSHGTLEAPPAVFPLTVDERTVGVVAIYSTLAQKMRFDTVDYELFNLLGSQAAWAIVSATLFAAAEHRLPGLEAFVDLSV
jgi:putative methionine-R-sulfoxide reductase with GAF domain/outer membrane murein-binding lipoprotein Lpp